MNIDTLSQPQKVASGSMLVVAVSAFLPWVSILGISVSGIEGDGAITLVCALAGLAALWLRVRVPRRLAAAVLWTGAAVTTLVALADMNGAAAIGLYLTLFGGIGWLGALVWARSRREPEGEEAVPDGPTPAGES
jgi:hypothetical protein